MHYLLEIQKRFNSDYSSLELELITRGVAAESRIALHVPFSFSFFLLFFVVSRLPAHMQCSILAGSLTHCNSMNLKDVRMFRWHFCSLLICAIERIHFLHTVFGK